MPASPYILGLRRRIGDALLMVPSVAAVIRDDRGRLLLQRKPGPEGWSLPAGAIDPGESPEDALRRELREETGRELFEAVLVAALGGQGFRHVYPNGDRVEYTVLLYRCDTRIVPDAVLDAETMELRFFDRRDMPSLALPYPAGLLFR